MRTLPGPLFCCLGIFFMTHASVRIDNRCLAIEPVMVEQPRTTVQLIAIDICGDLRSTNCYRWIERAGLCLMRSERASMPRTPG